MGLFWFRFLSLGDFLALVQEPCRWVVTRQLARIMVYETYDISGLCRPPIKGFPLQKYPLEFRLIVLPYIE